MSAEVPVYCFVEKRTYEWIEVSAVTLDEAAEKAKKREYVTRVLECSYIPGGIIT